MNYRTFVDIAVVLAGLFVSCGDRTLGRTTVPGVSFKPALLVIDIQKEYLPVIDQKDAKLGMEAIYMAIGVFRKYQYPVVRVHHTQIGQ
jgi:hypothetical protein